jgi:Lon protease-like protein
MNTSTYSLPLFPLNVVVCPDGQMPLKIFEARYLDMVKKCLKNKSSFAIVAVLPQVGNKKGHLFPFEEVGTLVDIVDADVTTVGLMSIRCLGHHRIRVKSYKQQLDGLLIGEVVDIANDAVLPVPEDLEMTSHSLKRFVESLPSLNISPDNISVVKPYKFDDASWVSNRWLELMDLPLIQKQRLMQLDSPIVRLELIHDMLAGAAEREHS